VKHTRDLERLSKSALPNAVRSTLNSIAFDVKKTTMPNSAKKNFVQRKPSFFKAKSRVEMASGSNISTMNSKVGFTGNDQAVEDLEQQEGGGKIKGRSFIPVKSARVGNSNNKSIRANARLKAIKNVVDSKNAKGKNDKEKFVKSVYFAGKGGYVLSNFKNRGYLWRVNSLNKTESKAFKLTLLYTFKKGRDVTVSKTGFMQSASLESAEKMEQIFAKEASRQFKKVFA